MSGYKYAGYLLGKHYRLLPVPLIKKLTMDPLYWKKLIFSHTGETDVKFTDCYTGI